MNQCYGLVPTNKKLLLSKVATALLILFSTTQAHAYDVIKTDKAQQGQDLCCKQMRCGTTFTSEERDRKGSGGSKNAGVTSDTISADTCYPAQVAAHGATALYAGATSYSVQALACTAACFANATAAGPALSKICEIYGYASGALDLIINYAITRNGQAVVDGLTGALMSTGMNLAGSALMGGTASTAATQAGAAGGKATERSGLDGASCFRAVVAGAMAATKFINASSSADEATRQYELKLETDKSSDTGSRLASYQSTANATGDNNAASGATSNPQSTVNTASNSQAATTPPSRDMSPATAIINSGMDDYLKKTTGVGTDQLMESYARGVKPSQALAALAGATIGENGMKLLEASEGLGLAAKLTPEQMAKIEPNNAPKIPEAAYAAARSGAANKGDDGMPDMNALMAGILEGLNPAKDGAPGPAGASNANLGRSPAAQNRMAGVHYFPPGDETTIFDLMNRSYLRLTARMTGTERQPASPSQFNESAPTVPGNPYLRRGQ